MQKGKAMNHNNRGLSLVELVVAMAIGSIVALAAFLFVGKSLRSYTVATDTINLQKESQVLMDQLAGWIMEGNRAVVQDDAVVGKVLVIYQIPVQQDSKKVPGGHKASQTASKRIIWTQNQKLYMIREEGISDVNTDSTLIQSNMAVDENCVSEYMEQFLVSIDATNPAKVTLDLKLSKGEQNHSVSDTVLIRNQLL